MKLAAHSRLKEPFKHKYVALIEYALEHDEFSANGVCEATGLTEKEFRFILASIFIPNGYQGQTVFDLDLKQKWVLRTEAYFSYLQYLEFCHAIEHARRAYWVAILAVIIALIGVGISAY
jgi:hypothetical protein